MPRLILLRHAESLWNQEGRFTGWGDPPLAETGVGQAFGLGRRLARENELPEAVFCSVLTRARQTLELALEAAGAAPRETILSWRLNERHCGQWEGMFKREVAGRSLTAWREQDRTRPPMLAADDPRHPRHDQRYRDLPEVLLPAGESHRDLRNRLEPLWRERISPSLSRRQCVWVVAHAGSLRSLAEMALASGGQPPVSANLPPGHAWRLEMTPAPQLLSLLTPEPG